MNQDANILSLTKATIKVFPKYQQVSPSFLLTKRQVQEEMIINATPSLVFIGLYIQSLRLGRALELVDKQVFPHYHQRVQVVPSSMEAVFLPPP